ncbi:MAG: magnesium transporter [Clostridia bacterium]|nr:magnesium transporter [Clostridia bacterium]
MYNDADITLVYTELTEAARECIRSNQYGKFREISEKLNFADTAELLEDEFEKSGEASAVRLFRMLPKSIAAEVFSFFDVTVQQRLITVLSTQEATEIMNDMYADDLKDMLEEMPANVVHKLLKNTESDMRRAVNMLLRYSDDSAGSIMTVEFLSLTAKSTVREAIERIRNEGIDKETVNTCFVLGENRMLAGTITLRKLILSAENRVISDIMETNPVYVSTDTDQEEVADIFQKYDLTSMPVVDSEQRLVGIITIDDVVDIIREEATEDMEKMAAITPSERPYLRTGVFRTYVQRIPWLLLLMLSATVTAGIIQNYEAALAACVALTAFVPMLTDTGGNSGSQASVTVMRGLSLNEIEFRDILKVVFKEFRVGVLCGITLGVANFIKMIVLNVGKNGVTLAVAGVISVTLCVTVVIAKIVGCSLPILAKKLRFDPAVMASPIITTLVDALALVVYFSIATALLGLN